MTRELAVAAVEDGRRSSARRLTCRQSRDRGMGKVLEVMDDRPDLGQLSQHVVAGEDLLDVALDVGAEIVSALDRVAR